MEKWRRTWRHGLVPQLSRAGLLALQTALTRNDPRLLQGVVSSPPPLDALGQQACRGACAIGYCGWQGDDLRSVAEVEAFFHRVCEGADAVFAEPAACRYFFNWFDDAPRAEMRRQLLGEVALALADRAAVAA
jgi:hypothetical protein